MSDLEPHASIEMAANWIVATPRNLRPRPIVVELRERFALAPLEAIEALRLANLQRSGGADDGRAA